MKQYLVQKFNKISVTVMVLLLVLTIMTTAVNMCTFSPGFYNDSTYYCGGWQPCQLCKYVYQNVLQCRI